MDTCLYIFVSNIASLHLVLFILPMQWAHVAVEATVSRGCKFTEDSTKETNHLCSQGTTIIIEQLMYETSNFYNKRYRMHC